MEPGGEKSKSVREIRGSNSCSKKEKGMNIEGYQVEGLSIGGHETCIIFPTLKVAFDIGRCPPRAVSQDFLLVSHAHMDHIVSLFISCKCVHMIQFQNFDSRIFCNVVKSVNDSFCFVSPLN